jgi:signal transduction histidine kinase
VERDLEKLFTFDELKRGVRSKLLKSGVAQKEVDEVIDIIAKKEEENNLIAENIRQAVAIYQGQATLGKIINVILHEGRKPLNFFKNRIPDLDFWASELEKAFDPAILDELIPIARGLGRNANMFVDLFSRLDPLATRKRGTKKAFNLFETLDASFRVFENELIQNGIAFEIDCPKDFMFTGWSQDIYVIMTNLIDNSIFWMAEKKSPKKQIDVTVVTDEEHLAYIDYRDSGPGIEAHLIESEVIFEPEFSTKNQGAGLGLAIAGEAATRNDLELKAFESDSGAYFRLQPK